MKFTTETYVNSAKVGICVILIVSFFTSIMFRMLKTFQGNYSGFLHLKAYGIERNPFVKNNPSLKNTLLVFQKGGHDTKFYYAVAFDPFLSEYTKDVSAYNEIVDSPRIRFARIGYPLLVRIFSLGHPEFFPKTMVWLILFSHAICALVLAKILTNSGASPFWSLLYVLIPGLTVSFVRALPESISLAFVLSGILLYRDEKRIYAILCFAMAILVRETSMVIVFVIGIYEFFKTSKKAGLAFLMSIFPYFFWKLFLTYRLFPEFGWSTLFYSAQSVTAPFMGIIEMLTKIRNQMYAPSLTDAAVFFAVLLSMLFVYSLFLLFVNRDSLAIVLAIYCILALCLDYDKIWSGLGNVERTTYESFALFLIVFPTTGKAFTRPTCKLAVLLLWCSILVYDVFFFTLKNDFQRALFLGYNL